ncbi:MAG: hypothetical protein IT449_06615 [Phycisphaerales bacterium]|nr:hypothetical protein [Phycisphaerales bacterium]
MRRSRVGLRGLGIWLLVAASPAGAVPPQWVDRAQDRDDWQRLFTLDLLEHLQLNKAQLAKLLPLYEEACRLRVEFYEHQRDAIQLALDAYPPYRDEKKLDRGITPAVEERAVKAHSRIKDLQIDFDGAMSELQQQVVETVLTPAQRRFAEQYEPSRARLIEEARGDAPHGKNGGDQRSAASRKGDAGVGHHAFRQQNGPTMKDDRQGEGRPTSRQGALENRLDSLQEELKEIEQFSHPRAGTLGKLVLSPPCAQVLYQGAGRAMPQIVQQAIRIEQSGTKDYPKPRMEQELRRVLDLKNEINDWNLVNGLRLSTSQIAYLEQAGLAADVARAQQQANRAPQQWLDTELRRLEVAARAVLQPGQRKVLDGFSTCFKGKPNLRDPVRIGQANNGTALEDWLERARTLDDESLQRAIEHRVDSEEKRLLGPMTDRERDGRVRMLRSATVQARGMDDVDFALNRTDLAKSAGVVSRAFEINKEMDKVRAELGEPGKITRLMFTDGFRAAIAERARQLRNPQLARGAPVAGEIKAENCDRSCALPKSESK